MEVWVEPREPSLGWASKVIRLWGPTWAGEDVEKVVSLGAVLYRRESKHFEHLPVELLEQGRPRWGVMMGRARPMADEAWELVGFGEGAMPTEEQQRLGQEVWPEADGDEVFGLLGMFVGCGMLERVITRRGFKLLAMCEGEPQAVRLLKRMHPGVDVLKKRK